MIWLLNIRFYVFESGEYSLSYKTYLTVRCLAWADVSVLMSWLDTSACMNPLLSAIAILLLPRASGGAWLMDVTLTSKWTSRYAVGAVSVKLAINWCPWNRNSHMWECGEEKVVIQSIKFKACLGMKSCGIGIFQWCLMNMWYWSFKLRHVCFLKWTCRFFVFCFVLLWSSCSAVLKSCIKAVYYGHPPTCN